MEPLADSFTLTLKINNKEINLNIHLEDDQEALFQKLKGVYPQCLNKREEVLGKLRSDLEGRVRSSAIKPDLKPTINYFLKKTFYKSQQPNKESCDK
jgi:hypothetical protein